MKNENDVFVELLVRRRRPGGEAFFKLGALLLGLALLAAAFLFVRSFFPVCFAVVVILEFFAFVYTVKEYEYSYMTGELDIDQINGKRKRSAVFHASCRDVRRMAPCEAGEAPPDERYARVLDASAGRKTAGRWYCIVDRADGGTELVYLSPNERLLAALKTALGRKMDYEPKAAHKDTAD